ncbi:GTPase [Lachnospiraceae bacterium 47-T17]
MLQSKNSLLLLAYAIISNEYIHIEQLKFLNHTIGKDENLHDRVYEILLDDDSVNKQKDIDELKEQLHYETEKDIKRLRKNIVRIMCYDGEYDEIEKTFMRSVFPGYEPKKIFIRRHIFIFHRRIHGTFFSRLFKFILVKLFHKGMPYFRYPKKRTANVCEGVDKTVFEAFKLALEAADQYRTPNIYAKLYELRNGYSESVKFLNDMEPTVALVGRTKAGKSTCLSVLCDMGSELIGKGVQRTTKLLTIGHYRGIKVIDTPGLGAAAIAGENDELKTGLACKMADEILFVMGNDTFDDSEICFMNELVNNNKPITIFFNYKENDVFRFEKMWLEFKDKPDSWRIDTGEHRISGWENHLMEVAREKGFDNIIRGRIYSVFLQAARYSLKRGKNIPSKYRSSINGSIKEWKNIYRASNYGQAINAFFSDFMENFNQYRLSQHVNFGKQALAELNICAQELRNRAEELKTERKQKLENLMNVKDEFMENFKEAFRVYISELHVREIMQFENGDDRAFSKRNEAFEKYIVELYNRVNEEACGQLEKMIKNKCQILDKQLIPYGICVKPLEAEEKIVKQISSFDTQGDRDFFKSKEFRMFVKASIGIAGRIFGKNPIGLGMTAAAFAVEHYSGKSASSWTDITKERDRVRRGEVDELLNEIDEYYIQIMDNFIQEVVNKIDGQAEILKSELNDNGRLEVFADRLCGITESADAFLTGNILS